MTTQASLLIEALSKSNQTAYPNEKYRLKSTPVILPSNPRSRTYTSFQAQSDGWVLYMGGRECKRSLCGHPTTSSAGTLQLPEQTLETSATAKKRVQVKGDVVIVLDCSDHYYHFLFDTLLSLWPLVLHGITDILADTPSLMTTVVCLTTAPKDTKSSWPTPTNVEFMQTLNFPFPQLLLRPPVRGGRDRIFDLVTPGATLLIPRHIGYFEDAAQMDPSTTYSRWLYYNMRDTLLNIQQEQQEQEEPLHFELFISRQGYRRGIIQEDQVYTALRKRLPNLLRVAPHALSVTQQARLFRHAKLIISPHGGALTNLVFSNWQKVVLLEVTGFHGTYRSDMRIPRHYVLKAQRRRMVCSTTKNTTASATSKCPKDANQYPMDVDPEHFVQVVSTILDAEAERNNSNTTGRTESGNVEIQYDYSIRPSNSSFETMD